MKIIEFTWSKLCNSCREVYNETMSICLLKSASIPRDRTLKVSRKLGVHAAVSGWIDLDIFAGCAQNIAEIETTPNGSGHASAG